MLYIVAGLLSSCHFYFLVLYLDLNITTFYHSNLLTYLSSLLLKEHYLFHNFQASKRGPLLFSLVYSSCVPTLLFNFSPIK